MQTIGTLSALSVSLDRGIVTRTADLQRSVAVCIFIYRSKLVNVAVERAWLGAKYAVLLDGGKLLF